MARAARDRARGGPPEAAPPPPPASEEAPAACKRILRWADAHFARTGAWPTKTSGRVVETLTETWCAVNLALRRGGRGLPGGTTLARFLLERRGARNHLSAPPLTVPLILGWADAFRAREGRWPALGSGAIPEAPGEVWCNVDAALRQGARGLPPGGSLARLLAAERGARNRKALPPLTSAGILAWADSFFAAQGRYPTKADGPVADAPGETWEAVNAALHNGGRGLPGGSSLARLLQRERGVRNRKGLPPLTEGRIVAWAVAHRRRTGALPSENSGAVRDAPGEVWANVNEALRAGLRGLPGGDSLARLLARELGARNSASVPRLSVEQVLGWADAHREGAGRWPTASSGEVAGAPGETWRGLDDALRRGLRGLPSGLSLARLLARHRGGAEQGGRAGVDGGAGPGVGAGARTADRPAADGGVGGDHRGGG